MLNRHRTQHSAEEAGVSADSPPGSSIELRSLAPEYLETQHATYVRHLESAIVDPRNRNIALTGRYGSGKSSILDRFVEQQHKANKKTLRVSINTLGPDDDDDLTNRIQKELVKQLVYRAQPGQIRRSRFARRRTLTWKNTLAEAVCASAVLVGLLWLFGVRPVQNALGPDSSVLSFLAFFILVTLTAWAGRWIVGNRLVSQFSTGGTSISFEERTDSFFDEYLDEIMAFFEATRPDLVLFEDLDRFDDPRIFDSLRELNTLINASAHWADRMHPLQFIYAIKDSLFEKLGEDLGDAKPPVAENPSTNGQNSLADSPVATKVDTAKEAVERANRTKFFEVVVPVVPFLSHNNARDLLQIEIDARQLPRDSQISRGLLDLVARHTTDMRLMKNICNEFVVFAQRLLWIDSPAPGLTQDTLFSLVVYKNFHLADFERLAHRESALDSLDNERDLLVAHAVKQLQEEKQELLSGERLRRDQAQIAALLGKRLLLLYQDTGSSIASLAVGNETLNADVIHQASFWSKVAKNRQLSVTLRHKSGHADNPTFGQEDLNQLFSEALDVRLWQGPDSEETLAKVAELNSEIAAIRGADYASLATENRFTLGGRTFNAAVNEVLESELARDLVRGGFVNRYYAEYSAAFYGAFIGVDVANFFRNSVWPNKMKPDFQFSARSAIENVIEQAPADFTRSRSCLNIQIVDYMLRESTSKAQEVVRFLVSDFGPDAQDFLKAFLREEATCKSELVKLLSDLPWRELFDRLALDEYVLDEGTRTSLLDAALLSARADHSYDLSEQTRALIVERHTKFEALTIEQKADTARTIFELVSRAGLLAPSLRPLSASMRPLFAERGAYELTADNLRIAIGLPDEEPIALEQVRNHAPTWERCKNDFGAYLDTVGQDSSTIYAVQTPSVLIEVVSEECESWSSDQIKGLLERSAPAASLSDITQVPQEVWPVFVTTRRVVPSAVNLHAYATVHGVDESLSNLLMVESGVQVEIAAVEDAEPTTVRELMVSILNASSVLGSRDRVNLALQLSTGAVEVSELEPSGDDLLADLLESELVPDTAESFKHFVSAGWNAVSRAFATSAAAPDFISPELVGGHVATLLRDPHVPRKIKAQVVGELSAYPDSSDVQTLREAASFAYTNKVPLPLSQLELIAPHVTDPEHLMWQIATTADGLDGTAIVGLLRVMGGDYSGFGGPPGHQFDVPVTESTKEVLNQIRGAGLVELPRGGARNRRRVTLA